MVNLTKLKLPRRSSLFVLLALVILVGLVYGIYLWRGVEIQDKTLGTSLWNKRNLASSWAVEFEGEVKALSSSEVTLKIGEEEITVPLASQTTFFERKSVEVKGVSGAYNLEPHALTPDDFNAQAGKQAKVLLMLIDNDLKGIQVVVLSL